MPNAMLSRGDHVTTENLSGVALWFADDCDEHEGCAIVIMVGDDYRHHTDRESLVAIGEDDFCSSCGQIGCGW